jgi:hypothetical protein
MHAMKAYEGRECIAPFIINLAFTFRLLYPRYLLNSRLDEPQIWSGGFWRREITFSCWELKNSPSVTNP